MSTARERIAAASDRGLARAQAMVDALPAGELSTRKGRTTVTITERPRVVRGAVELRVAVIRSGRDVTPPDLNPVRIVNPPVLVPDPAGDVVVTSMVRSRPGAALVPLERRFREDPAAALLSIVADLV